MKKKQFKRYALIVTIGILSVIVVLLCFAIWKLTVKEKLPQSYTWEEFEALPPEEQLVFPDRFESMDDVNNWLNNAQGNTVPGTMGAETIGTEIVETVPVPTFDFGDKAPEDYTWEDYQKLTPDEQMLFPDAFDSMEDFNSWLNRVQPEATTEATAPNSSDIGLSEKKPEDYTWEDYLALSIEEQMLFPDCFESYELFEAWWEQNCPGEE